MVSPSESPADRDSDGYYCDAWAAVAVRVARQTSNRHNGYDCDSRPPSYPPTRAASLPPLPRRLHYALAGLPLGTPLLIRSNAKAGLRFKTYRGAYELTIRERSVTSDMDANIFVVDEGACLVWG